MKNNEIFRKAIGELKTKNFNGWLCYAYGVFENTMTDIQAKLLLEAIEQDKKEQIKLDKCN